MKIHIPENQCAFCDNMYDIQCPPIFMDGGYYDCCPRCAEKIMGPPRGEMARHVAETFKSVMAKTFKSLQGDIMS